MDYSSHLDGIDLEKAPQHKYAGIRTFLRSEIAEPDELTDDVDIAAVGIPYDGGQSKRAGARLGPAAIRKASLLYTHMGVHERRNVETGRQVNYNDLTVRDCGDTPVAPASVQHTRAAAEAYVEEISKHAFPVIIGGDHYCTLPAFMGYAKAVDENVGIIHLDAHSDTSRSTPTMGTHWNGTEFPLIHGSEYGGWENHAIVGLRGYENIEDEDLHINYHTDILDKGIEACVEEAIEHATAGVEHVYVSVDIDVVDPGEAPGTGSPEPGGISSNELFRAMDRIGQVDEVGAFDIVEVAPEYDPTINTQQIGARAIMRLLEAKFF